MSIIRLKFCSEIQFCDSVYTHVQWILKLVVVLIQADVRSCATELDPHIGSDTHVSN